MTLNIRHEDVHKMVKQIASATGKTQSPVIREAVEEMFNRTEKIIESRSKRSWTWEKVPST